MYKRSDSFMWAVLKINWYICLLIFIYIRRSGPVSLVCIATGYGLDGPGIESRRGRDFPPVQTGPGSHPASYTTGIGSFPGVKSDRSVTLTPHSLLVPWSWRGRALPLLPLWAVRPVQSISACTGVQFTYFFIYVEPKTIHNVEEDDQYYGANSGVVLGRRNVSWGGKGGGNLPLVGTCHWTHRHFYQRPQEVLQRTWTQ